MAVVSRSDGRMAKASHEARLSGARGVEAETASLSVCVRREGYGSTSIESCAVWKDDDHDDVKRQRLGLPTPHHLLSATLSCPMPLVTRRGSQIEDLYACEWVWVGLDW